MGLYLNSQVGHKSCWHILPNIAGQVRRNPTVQRINRNLPILESAVDVVTKASQSKELSAFMQAFNGSNSSSDHALLGDLDIIKTIGQCRFVVGIIGMIAGLGKIAHEISIIAIEIFKGRTRERNDAIVRLSEGVITLGDAVSSFGKSLSMAGWVDQSKILNWALPLGYISALLSSITVYINWRSKNDSIELLAKVTESYSKENDQVDFSWLEEEISNPNKDGEYYLQKHFEVANREKYGAQVLYIIKERSQEPKMELQKALKDRLSDKISAHNKAIVSTIISIFASICLFFPVLGTPMVFVGLGLAIFAGAISVHKYLKDKNSIKLFEKRINDIQSFDDISPEWVKDHASFAIPCLDEKDQKSFKGTAIELPPIRAEMFQTEKWIQNGPNWTRLDENRQSVQY
jgi:hypothetical protein